MNLQNRNLVILSFVVAMTFAASNPASPVLTPGTWANLTPPVDLSSGTYGFIDIKFDPNNRSVLYALLDQKGLWKSVNGGSTWTRIGLNAVADGDSPQQMQVDPNNGQHLYMANGVRGPNIGFWVSTDGGATWTMPAGFRTTALAAPVGTTDCYSVAVEPGDFNHLLVSFHSGWSGYSNNCGVLESTDGGTTWRAVAPPAGANTPGYAVVFLKNQDPAHTVGNGNTWLLATQGAGLFKTTDAGATWTMSTTQPMTHGAFDPHYISNGNIYVGLSSYPTLGMQIARSTDNGSTWQSAGANTPLGEYTYYHSVIGDGYHLYAKPGYNGCTPVITSLETDGNTWTYFNTQDFSPVSSNGLCGPTHQVFDSANGIIYSACWGAGIWALKVIKPATAIARPATVAPQTNAVAGDPRNPDVSIFNLNGRKVDRNTIANGGAVRSCTVYILRTSHGTMTKGMYQTSTNPE